MSWILEDAQEAKRKIDVAAMKQVRPPRVGDLCSVFSGIIHVGGKNTVWVDDVTIIDMNIEDGQVKQLKFARLADKNSGNAYQTFTYEIGAYLIHWKYKDDHNAETS